MDNKNNDNLSYDFNFELRPSSKESPNEKTNTEPVQKPSGYQPPKQQSLAEIAAESEAQALKQRQLVSNANIQNKSTMQTNYIKENVPNKGTINQINNQGNSANIPNNNNSFENNEDTELIKAFIGPNYEIISKKGFNFAAAFFGYLYLFYRKMMLYGFIAIFVVGTCTSFIINDVNGILSSIDLNIKLKMLLLLGSYFLIHFFIYGYFTNKLYIPFVKSKIRKIKLTNTNYNYEQIKNACIKKGGRSIGRVFLGILLPIIMFIIVLIIMVVFFKVALGMLFGNISNIKNQSNESSTTTDNQQNSMEMGEFIIDNNGSFVTDASINIAEKFTISIPSKFTSESKTDYYKGTYNNSAYMGSECSFGLYKVYDETDKNELINSFDDTTTPFNNTTINGINWSWRSAKDTIGEQYMYITDINDSVYVFLYNVDKGTDSECITYKNQILNSIRSK